MTPSPSPYFSYLLRLWLAGDDDQPEWRLALTDSQSDQIRGFPNLEALAAFLQARMEEAQAGESGKRSASPESSSGEDALTHPNKH
jgi:hypothetical protein